MKLSKSIKWLSVLALLGGVSCGLQTDSKTADFDATPESLIQKLKRQRGQKEFLTLTNQQNFRANAFAEAAFAPRMAMRGGAKRTIVTSDLFSVLPPSDDAYAFDLLYSHSSVGLLHYGVSKQQDTDSVQADLISAFVNPDVSARQQLMYTDANRKLAVIVEQSNKGAQLSSYRFGADGAGYLQTLEIEGSLTDHRMLTTDDSAIIYTVSTELNRGDRRSYIKSFSLNDDGSFTEIAEFSYDGSVAYTETVNIVETVVNDELKYFVIAPMPSYYKWSTSDDDSIYGRATKVDGGLMLVDISSTEGQIGDAYQFPLEGRISDLQNTNIVDGVIESVSNSRFYGGPAVAYERSEIPFTTEGITVLSEEEAKAKITELAETMKNLLEAKRVELAEAEEVEDVDKFEIPRELKARLAADFYQTTLEQVGLTNAFTKRSVEANGETKEILAKVKSDWYEPIAGPIGARMNRVAYHKDLIFITWEPVNNVDPISIYQRGGKDNPPQLRGLVTFEQGVLQKSLPVSVEMSNGEERLFVIGFGNRQTDDGNVPIAKAFKLVEDSDVDGNLLYEPVAIGSVDLAKAGTFLDWRSHDRYTLFEYDEESQVASLLVQTNDYSTGRIGSILANFDFKKAFASASNAVAGRNIITTKNIPTAPEADSVKRLLGLSPTRYDWLVDLDVVGSIGNNLTVFDVPLVGEANKVGKVLAVVELARSVDAFTTIGSGDNKLGVQFVAKRYTGRDVETGIELRLVPMNDVDAAKAATLNSGAQAPFLPGQIVGKPYHTKDGSLVVVTRTTKTREVERDGEKFPEEYSAYTATKVSVAGSEDKGLSLTAKASSWDGPAVYGFFSPITYARASYLPYAFDSASVEIAELENGDKTQLLVIDNEGELRAFNPGQGVAAKVQFTGWNARLVDGRLDAEIKASKFLKLDGDVYFFSQQAVNIVPSSDDQPAIKKGPEQRVTYNTVAGVRFIGDELQISGTTNVPGTPVAVVEREGDTFYLTDDRFVERNAQLSTKVEYELVKDKAVPSMTIAWDQDAEQQAMSLAKANGNFWIYSDSRDTSKVAVGYYGSLSGRGSSAEDVHVLSNGSLVFTESDGQSSELIKTKINSNGRFMDYLKIQLTALESELGSEAARTVLAVWESPSEEGTQYVALATQGNKMEVAKIGGANDGVEFVELAATNSRGYTEYPYYVDFRTGAPTDPNQVTFDAQSGTITIADPSTMSVRQYQIVELAE